MYYYTGEVTIVNNGFIIQYGFTELEGGHNYTTFPLSFTSSYYNVAYEHYWQNGSQESIIIAKTTQKEYSRIFTQTMGVTTNSEKTAPITWNVGLYYMAIGY